MVNVSPRLVHYALKVLQNGCGELIAAIESGVLAGEEQRKAVAGGAKEDARKVRELRAGKSGAVGTLPAPSLRPSPGNFGVGGVEASGPHQGENAGQDRVVLLWVAAGRLDDGIDARKSRSFRYAPSEA